MKRVLPISIPTVATARMVERGMVVLLVLTSPDALSEPLGAGARPVHSFATFRCNAMTCRFRGAKQTLTPGSTDEFMCSRPKLKFSFLYMLDHYCPQTSALMF